jgi:outer membrane protein TolC
MNVKISPITLAIFLTMNLNTLVAAQSAATLSALLPAEEPVKQALMASPDLSQARANKNALQEQAAAVEAGHEEFTVSTTSQRRRIFSSDNLFTETSISLERPIRAWGKGHLDRQIAEQTQQFAQTSYADALHEASRDLLKLWFELLRTQANADNAQHHIDIAKQNNALAQKRLKAGEISKLDAQLAQAEEQLAQAHRQNALAQNLSAQALFRKRYPDLPLPQEHLLRTLEQENLPAPLQEIAQLQKDFIESNHELLLLRTQAQQMNFSAQRQDRDRYPDPTVGIFTSSEFGADEKITGITLSIPISGEARTHLARSAHAQALAAQDLVTSTERRLSANFESMLTQYNLKVDATAQLQAAAQTQTSAANKSRVAYTLGEISMSEMLQVNRLAREHQLSAELAHLELLELLSMIRLDLHQIYDFDD